MESALTNIGRSVYRCTSSARTISAHAAPSETPEQSKTPRRPATSGEALDLLLGHLLAELRPRVARAVGVVLPRDVRHRRAHVARVDAVLAAVRRVEQRER